MPAKITREFIDSLPPQGKSHLVWDADVKGLGVRLTANNARSWVLKYWSRPTQKTRWYTLAPFDALSPTQARKRARKLLVEIADGGDPSEERQRQRTAETMNDLFDRFLADHVAVKTKPRTQEAYGYVVEKYLRPGLGSMKIEAVTRGDVARFHSKNVHIPRTANHAVAILRKAFNCGIIWGLRKEGSNPATLIQKYQENARTRFLSETEINRLGQALDNSTKNCPWSIAAIRFLLYSGMRVGEVCAMERNWIDFENGFVALPDAKAGARIQPLSDIALDILREVPRAESLPWVFVSPFTSAALSEHTLRQAWARIRKKADIEDVRLHDLRHTVGTYSGMAGGNAFLVRDLLGHKGLEMTSRYVSQDTAPVRALANLVGDRINAALQK